ncbi:MAG: YqaJ viral recombinase family protein [Candidatus Omnitrophota bacterium]
MPFTKEELEERKNYLGGTDCAPILGISRWKTPIEVWAEKTGLIEPEDISSKPQVRFGVKMEPVLAEMWEEDEGKKLARKNETIKHPKYSFIGANIDRRVVGEKAGWEAKYFSPYRAKEFENGEIPADCLLQCCHYLAVTGWDRWYLMAGLGNGEPIKLAIERDDKLIEDIIKKEVYFWNTFIVPKAMPKMVTSKDDEILQKLYPEALAKKEIKLTDEANQLLESLTALNQDKNAVEGQIDTIKNKLKAMIKDNEIGLTDQWRIRWSNVKGSEYKVVKKAGRKFTYDRITQTED